MRKLRFPTTISRLTFDEQHGHFITLHNCLSHSSHPLCHDRRAVGAVLGGALEIKVEKLLERVNELDEVIPFLMHRR